MGKSSVHMGNIGLMGGISGKCTNAPKEYKDRQRQYFADETVAFAEEYAKYSPDYVKANIQGLIEGDFYAWSVKYIRVSDTIKQGISLTRKTDDQKAYLIPDRRIDYVPEGAKLETMGSTWFVTNPSNISGATASGIMRRCNATWNHYDFYGNLLKEPILIEKSQAMANANDFQEVSLIMQGYFNVIVQRNDETEELDQNSRIILGRRAYQITGYSDVVREFTEDESSSHLLYFAARMQEPNLEIDDMENHVAGGKTFSWIISISGAGKMRAGSAVQFTASSVRNGETVSGTDARPVSYIWTSSDDTIATVGTDGTVRALRNGVCRITCALLQNQTITQSFDVAVEAAESGNAVEFSGTVPTSVSAYESAEISAQPFQNGEKADGTVEWIFEGADAGAYTAQIDGNRVKISCWGASAAPLTITAGWNGARVSAEVQLLGL